MITYETIKAREKDAEQRRRKQAATDQAGADLEYYRLQLETLTELEQRTRKETKKARRVVAYDEQCNRYGAAIPEKTTAAHVAALEKLERKLLRYNQQIHATENRIRKALYILAK